jgi:hypothetical protein
MSSMTVTTIPLAADRAAPPTRGWAIKATHRTAMVSAILRRRRRRDDPSHWRQEPKSSADHSIGTGGGNGWSDMTNSWSGGWARPTATEGLAFGAGLVCCAVYQFWIYCVEQP